MIDSEEEKGGLGLGCPPPSVYSEFTMQCLLLGMKAASTFSNLWLCDMLHDKRRQEEGQFGLTPHWHCCETKVCSQWILALLPTAGCNWRDEIAESSLQQLSKHLLLLTPITLQTFLSMRNRRMGWPKLPVHPLHMSAQCPGHVPFCPPLVLALLGESTIFKRGGAKKFR